MVCERIAVHRHEYGIVTKGEFTREFEAHQVGVVMMMSSSRSGGGSTVAIAIDSCTPPSSTSRPSSWLATQVHRGGESVMRAWDSRPRDAARVLQLARQNLVTVVAVLLSGIIMWESSTDQLRERMGDTIVFPLYLPHAVSTSMAALWNSSVVPGNLVGLYLVRVYMTERGAGLTSLGGSVLFLVSVLATVQSHVGAFYLHKGLCKGRSHKKYPTIDTVADAVWFLVIVAVTSIVFSTLIALCVTLTPLAKWRCFWRFWITWWLGILAAMITMTPLIVHLMAWKCSPNLKRPVRMLEVAVTAGMTLGLLSVVFFLDLHGFRPMPYLCFPLITYTALRFNRIGWAVTVTAVAFYSALGSIHGRGAVHAIVGLSSSWNTQLILQVQLFSIVMGVVSITLAAAVREKKSLTRRLHQMNRDLECTVQCRTRQLLKTNEELQISQKKAEMASHAKSDFLANMSHEIRTPIHGILGLTALLLESELTVDQKDSLVSVKECADLLLHIINSVLDLAKIEAGRLEIETVPFNVRKMVSSTLRMMQAKAQERGLKLCWDVDRAVPSSLAGDVGKLQQCLINLVGNALKFTHEGCISVHVRVASDSLLASKMNALHAPGPNVHSSRMSAAGTPDSMSDYESVVASTPERMFIHFEVRDTGIGINKEKLKDMFEPFTQADASTSRLYGGTGLGLCIVHRFVELLGGTIWVESETGKGSAFHFCLPLVLSAATASLESSPREKSPSPSSKLYKKPWSLMGGLVFNPEYYPRRDSTVISVDDLSAYVSRKKETSSSSLSKGGSSHQLPTTNFSIIDDPCGHGRRSSSSDYEALFKEFRSARRDSFHPRPRWNGDRGASNDVITPTLEESASTIEIEPSQALPSVITTASFEGPLLDREETESVAETSGTGTLKFRLHKISSEMSSPYSELSRDSSTELESLLIEKKLQLKILLAEDNPINQKVASRQLQKHGHVVTVVGDGQQALDTICAQHDQFDLVLMDVQMPVMDGLAATEQIRIAETEKGWSRVPILGLTAHAIQGYQDTCLTHGMDGYLGKPFDILQLLKTIGHMLPRE